MLCVKRKPLWSNNSDSCGGTRAYQRNKWLEIWQEWWWMPCEDETHTAKFGWIKRRNFSAGLAAVKRQMGRRKHTEMPPSTSAQNEQGGLQKSIGPIVLWRTGFGDTEKVGHSLEFSWDLNKFGHSLEFCRDLGCEKKLAKLLLLCEIRSFRRWRQIMESSLIYTLFLQHTNETANHVFSPTCLHFMKNTSVQNKYIWGDSHSL